MDEYDVTYSLHEPCVRTNEEKTMAAMDNIVSVTINSGKPKLSKLAMLTDKQRERILKKCDGDIFGEKCVFSILKNGGTTKGNQHVQVRYGNRRAYLTRLLYHNFVENITNEKSFILHKCDTDGRCVCLAHLYVGTLKQNAADRTAHGNTRINSTNAKLTEDNVREIRKRYRGGETQAQIAKRFKIDRANVSYIVRWKTWKDVV